MSRLKIITKYFIKNALSEMFGNNKFNSATIIIFMILLVGMFSAPIAMMVGGSYAAFHSISQEGVLLSSVVSLGSTITFLFGIYTVLNIFYFSNDIEQILPLPFKSSDILFGKFAALLINMYVYTGIIVLPLIVYGVVSKASFIYYVYAIIAILIAPILPMILGSLICMVLMRFTSLSKHKDAFKMFTGSLSLVLIVVFNFFTQRSNSSDKFAEIVKNSGKTKMNVINDVFITNKLSSYGLLYNNNLKGFIYMILALATGLIIFYVYYIIGGKLYLKGIIGSSESYSKKENVLKNRKSSKLIKVNSPLKALALKDIKVIFRTPQLFINCVAMILYMPAIMGLSMMSGIKLIEIRKLIYLNTKWYAMVLVVCFIVGNLCVMGGGAGTTALSREGKDFMVSKYIPVDYKVHLNSKILSCLCVNEIGILVVLAGLILVKANPLLIILGVISSFGAILVVTLLGMHLDYNSPRLDWEDEKALFKSNYKPMLIMVLIFFIGLILVGLALVIRNYIIIFAVLMVIVIIATFILYKKLLKLAYKIYNEN